MSELPVPAERGESGLDELVIDFLARTEDGEAVDLERFCEAHPEHASALRLRISALRDAGLIGDAGPAGTERMPERLGEFRLLERLGGGGMGVVYRAEQTSLGRAVALKLIRPEQLYFPGARERFRREVEAVGKLAHPGIVPVYTFGEERGLPYFAMELVEGVTLGEVLRALTGRAPETISGRDLAELLARRGIAPQSAPLFSASWPNVCLDLVRQVAHALAHAHERGVLHRDVKPSNVLLTADGRARLFDFGLARDASASRITRTGAQMGSYAYMPPELFRGAKPELDERADIYALGVTFYELATLRLPFEDASAELLFRSIVERQPAAPRARNPQLSADAETVCLVAMEREPARRYASASALARDLENVLARRPIEARRPSALVRTVRWIERHPAGAVALGLVIAGPLALALQARNASARDREASLLIASKNAELSASLGREQDERARAQASFERAREAIEFFLGRVGTTELENVPQMTGLRRELLDKALALYDDLLRGHPADPEARVQLAVIARSRGSVLGYLGRFDEAEAAFADGIARVDGLRGDAEVEADATGERAAARVNLANLIAQRGRRGEARGLYALALDEWREVVARLPASAAPKRELANALYNAAWLEESEGFTERAEALCLESEEILRPLIAAADGADEARSLQADLLALRASNAKQRGDWERALELWTHTRALQEQLVAAHPEQREWRIRLAESCSNSAGILRESGRRDEAMALWRRALALAEELERDYPGEPRYTRVAASVAANLAASEIALEHLDTARALLDQAVTRLDELHAANPEFLENVTTLASALVTRGQLHRVEDELDDAERVAARAVALLVAAGERNPEAAALRELLAVAKLSALDVLRQRGEHAAVARALMDDEELFGRQARTSLDAAGLWSLCVDLAESDEHLSEDEKPQVAGEYLDRARLCIERANERGLRDATPLLHSGRLERVRRERWFKLVLQRFEVPGE